MKKLLLLPLLAVWIIPGTALASGPRQCDLDGLECSEPAPPAPGTPIYEETQSGPPLTTPSSSAKQAPTRQAAAVAETVTTESAPETVREPVVATAAEQATAVETPLAPRFLAAAEEPSSSHRWNLPFLGVLGLVGFTILLALWMEYAEPTRRRFFHGKP